VVAGRRREVAGKRREGAGTRREDRLFLRCETDGDNLLKDQVAVVQERGLDTAIQDGDDLQQ
jgi:hypothetical protein